MYELTMFMTCNRVEKVRWEGKETMQITMPMVAPRVYRIPGTISFNIVFGILGVDTTKANVLHNLLTDPRGTVVFESIGEMPGRSQAERVPEEYRALVGYANLWDVNIEQEGIYTFTINCNDTLVDTVSIPIFLDWANWLPPQRVDSRDL